jgi:hypothetical protein
MKHLFLLSLLAACWPVAVAQQPSEKIDSVTIASPGRTISLPAQVSRVYRGGFDELVGEYAMSNGQTMILRTKGNRKYAIIAPWAPIEVVSTAEYEFVGLQKQLKIMLSEPGLGGVTGTMLLALPPLGQAMSSAPPPVQAVDLVAAR